MIFAILAYLLVAAIVSWILYRTGALVYPSKREQIVFALRLGSTWPIGLIICVWTVVFRFFTGAWPCIDFEKSRKKNL